MGRYLKYYTVILLALWFVVGSLHIRQPAAGKVSTSYDYGWKYVVHTWHRSTGHLRSSQPKQVKYKFNKSKRWLKEAGPYLSFGLNSIVIALETRFAKPAFFIPDHPFLTRSFRLNPLRGPPPFFA